jgi:hypothetical protein
MIDYSQILGQKYKGSEWTLNGDEYDGLTWLSETTKPTKKELDDLWLEVKSNIKTEADAKAAQRQAILNRLGITEEEARILLGGN